MMKYHTIKAFAFSLFLQIFLFLSVFGQAQFNQTNLKKHIQMLASEQMEGRETGSPGSLLAGEYITERFREAGLTPPADYPLYKQEFRYTHSVKYGNDNVLFINDTAFELTKDFYPLSFTKVGFVEGEIINAGYGISAPELGYDDYKNLKDIRRKFLVIEVSSPDGIHPHSKYIEHTDLKKKADVAMKHGAAGVIFINSDTTAEDASSKLLKTDQRHGLTVIFAKNHMIALLKSGRKLHCKTKVEVSKQPGAASNILGMIDNGAKQTVIIGAHYDHLGRGAEGSLHPYKGDIHYGADDNASGVSAMIELARWIKEKNLKGHNYLFVAFTGEEMGLLGSAHFVKASDFVAANYDYMINFDMVGRLDSTTKTLGISGTGTSPVWNEMMKDIDVKDLKIKSSESGVGPSDHTSFYYQNIPALHFFSGNHSDYHKPSDREDLINYEGIVRILDYTSQLVEKMDAKPKPEFTKTKESESAKAPNLKVTLGVMPDYFFEGPGMRIDGVSEGKPAEKAGLQKGDIITQIGETQISDIHAYMKALSQFKKGDKTKGVIIRQGKEMAVQFDF